MLRVAPAGTWPTPRELGEEVVDIAAGIVQSRSVGFSMLHAAVAGPLPTPRELEEDGVGKEPWHDRCPRDEYGVALGLRRTRDLTRSWSTRRDGEVVEVDEEAPGINGSDGIESHPLN